MSDRTAPAARAAGSTAREAGFTLMEMLFLLLVLLIVGSAVFAVTVRGTRDAANGTDRQTARGALQEKLAGDPPAADGGSVLPDPPAEGYSDVVIGSPDGSFVPFGGTPASPGTAVVRRQWRVATGPDGIRHFQVSAELLDSDGRAPRSDDGAYSVVMERRVRAGL